MGLQVIQAKRLVEQEKISSNAFHQGVQSLSDPFASKLAHLLCFNFDELYDIYMGPHMMWIRWRGFAQIHSSIPGPCTKIFGSAWAIEQ